MSRLLGLGGLLSALLPARHDDVGVVHRAVEEAVRTTPAGKGFRIQGKHVIVGEVTEIRDERPKAYEKLGRPLVTKVMKPTHVHPRDRSRYNPRVEDKKHALQAKTQAFDREIHEAAGESSDDRMFLLKEEKP